ncbi:hypothetical protein BC940DRAFT_295994 [Gongronella butleri]|nr:hypothetical protein BC940DRAFT_295994 [Gongronella butleri]
MVEAMDLDFYSKLSTRQDEIAALQAQNARLTRQFELERKEWDQTRYVGMEQLKRAQTRIHQLEESVQRANLKDVDVGNFAIDWHAMDPSSSSSSSSASSSSASGLPPHPSSSSSSASSNMSSAATAAYLSKKKRRADEYLERQVQELRSRLHQSNLKAQQRANTLEERLAKSQETEAQCKRLIASCCNLPLNKIDDLIGPLTTAIENDPPDMDFARVIGFMERLRQHQQ